MAARAEELTCIIVRCGAKAYTTAYNNCSVPTYSCRSVYLSYATKYVC